jgi:arginyl-tRNA synthetase
LEASGALVWRGDYFGDVGVHVAKAVWGMIKLLEQEESDFDALGKQSITQRQRFLGRAYALGAKAFEEDEQAKQDMTALNTQLYCIAQQMHKGDPLITNSVDYGSFAQPMRFDKNHVAKLYNQGRAWSLEYFETLYARLGTQFKGYYPESRVGEIGYGLVKEGLEKGIFEKSDGAVVFPGEKYGLHTRVFINKHGLPTYEGKELGLAPAKFHDFPYEKSIIVTGNEINEYFKVLLQAMTLLVPELGKVTTHIGHGMVRLPEGKMSSRTGKVITGDSLLNQAKEYALGIINDINPNLADKEEIADMVGIASIKYAFLKANIGKDVVYSFKEAISFSGNSGPYIQYTYARCRSVLEKGEQSRNLPLSQDYVGQAGIKESKEETNNQVKRIPEQRNSVLIDGDIPLLGKEGLGEVLRESSSPDSFTSFQPITYNYEELTVLRYLYQFPEVVAQSASELAPHHICTYVYELSQRYNTFYNKHSILQAGDENLVAFRLKLTQAVSIILHSGLDLLGIQAPERM